ncbi:hypothetical protein HGO38_15630 [Rhizobium sp. CG5]|uniref:hypothetical protein n=1 Tax=Rhizobium sp. CG5 TaxID=2726076 RepID=UPI002033DE15|nr:hypothetical protein [Rhizobium sp. CG5]MCM2474912.1 hypothetical protein [Rhizobium sp. CG5]
MVGKQPIAPAITVKIKGDETVRGKHMGAGKTIIRNDALGKKAGQRPMLQVKAGQDMAGTEAEKMRSGRAHRRTGSFLIPCFRRYMRSG